jgi:hypothetical protein
LPNSIESQVDWEAHLASLEEALQPVGAWEKLCVYRIALSAWKHFRLVRHETAIVSAAILNPDKPSYDDDYVGADDVTEVLQCSEASLAEELCQMRDLATRVSALASNGEGVTFTAAERRQVLSAVIEQFPDEDEAEEEDVGEGEDAATEDDSKGGRAETTSEDDPNDDVADNEDPVIVPAAQLREEIGQLAAARGLDLYTAARRLVQELSGEIENRQHRQQLARRHIGISLVPDERNVNRLALYERQLDAASRRYLNDLYRAQALRLGQPVAAPIALDVNVTEQGNGLH